jgi:hypothetical protein
MTEKMTSVIPASESNYYPVPVPTTLDNGRRSPRKLLRAVVARLLGRKPG